MLEPGGLGASTAEWLLTSVDMLVSLEEVRHALRFAVARQDGDQRSGHRYRGKSDYMN